MLCVTTQTHTKLSCLLRDHTSNDWPKSIKCIYIIEYSVNSSLNVLHNILQPLSYRKKEDIDNDRIKVGISSLEPTKIDSFSKFFPHIPTSSPFIVFLTNHQNFENGGFGTVFGYFSPKKSGSVCPFSWSMCGAVHFIP